MYAVWSISFVSDLNSSFKTLGHTPHPHHSWTQTTKHWNRNFSAGCGASSNKITSLYCKNTIRKLLLIAAVDGNWPIGLGFLCTRYLFYLLWYSNTERENIMAILVTMTVYRQRKRLANKSHMIVLSSKCINQFNSHLLICSSLAEASSSVQLLPALIWNQKMGTVIIKRRNLTTHSFQRDTGNEYFQCGHTSFKFY